MKTEKEIDKLGKKYVEMEKKLYDQHISINKKFEKEQNYQKKIHIIIDELIPTAVKGMVVMDKLNTLMWVKIPNLKQPLPEDISNLNNLLKQQLKMATDIPINSGEQLINVLNSLKLIVDNQFRIIDEQFKIIKELKNSDKS